MTARPVSERLEAHAREWGVTVEAVKMTETSLIASGTRRTQRVVLKVARTEGEEWRSGEILAAFDGNGLVTALEFRDGAVLLERLDPGHDLSRYSMAGRDDEATEIIADVIAQMSRVRPAIQGIRSAQELIPDFQKYRHTRSHLLPIGMIDRAERIFAELCESQTDVRLLHGDLPLQRPVRRAARLGRHRPMGAAGGDGV
jgi:streptomycin 6-kinase